MPAREDTIVRPAPIGRPRWEPDAVLSAGDLAAEQRHRRQRRRRHDRLLHGPGVVCGLRVVPAADPARPWAVLVCPGYGITPPGDEVEVRTPAPVDVRDYLWRRPLEPSPAPGAWVGIRYAEEPTRPVPARPAGCGCDETTYCPSRTREGFQIDVLWELPANGQAVSFDLCSGTTPSCPDCPESPYLILARLALPASEGDPITAEHIEAAG
jgi:hypothetical protein